MIKNSFKKNALYVFIIFFLFFLYSYKCEGDKLKINKDCKENCITNFIQLKLSCNKDSVKFGEIVTCNLTFENKTDSIIRFYPKRKMLICQESSVYGPLDRTFSKIFSDTIDDTKIITIQPKKSYISQYKVLISQERMIFYTKGINDIYILFLSDISNSKKGTSTKSNQKNGYLFCGHMKSNKIRLVID